MDKQTANKLEELMEVLQFMMAAIIVPLVFLTLIKLLGDIQ